MYIVLHNCPCSLPLFYPMSLSHFNSNVKEFHSLIALNYTFFDVSNKIRLNIYCGSECMQLTRSTPVIISYCPVQALIQRTHQPLRFSSFFVCSVNMVYYCRKSDRNYLWICPIENNFFSIENYSIGPIVGHFDGEQIANITKRALCQCLTVNCEQTTIVSNRHGTRNSQCGNVCEWAIFVPIENCVTHILCATA